RRQMKEDDFQYAIENTQVILAPEQKIATFGTTSFRFYLISELMDRVNEVRVRDGKIHADRPQILTPEHFSRLLLEGFGEKAKRYIEKLRELAQNMAVLRYGFQFRKTDVTEQMFRDHRFNRIAKHLFGHVGLAKLKSVAQHGHVLGALAKFLDVTFRFLAKPFQQQPAEMFRRENLRTVGVNFSVADAHFIHPIHQFGNQIKSKTGRAEGGDPLLGREDHLRVLDRVLEIIFLHLAA